MTNLERWHFYCRDYPSPDSYVELTWLFTVAGALQRRVWLDSAWEIFPNLYIMLCAPPGVGKSIVNEAKNMLLHFDEKGVPATNGDSSNSTKSYLFPISPDSTSVQKLMDNLARKPQNVPGRPPYYHSSVSFILDELASIFKSNAEDMMTFLLTAWPCPKTYDDQKIVAGSRYIRNMFINLIGGIQPDVFSRMKRVDVLSNGFMRRFIIAYETMSRSRIAIIPPHSEEQLAVKQELLVQLLKLSKLYGKVTYTPDAVALINEWHGDVDKFVLNKSPYLIDYYQSKIIQAQKLAMCYHFSESTAMVIGIDPLRRAIKFLESLEHRMHYPFIPSASTDVADVKADVVKLLFQVPAGMTVNDMYRQFQKKLSHKDFLTVISDLLVANTVERTGSNKVKLKDRHAT